MSGENGHGHASGHSHEGFEEVTVLLEDDQIEGLNELLQEYRAKLGDEWDLSAIIRVAVGDFLTKMGKMS